MNHLPNPVTIRPGQVWTLPLVIPHQEQWTGASMPRPTAHPVGEQPTLPNNGHSSPLLPGDASPEYPVGTYISEK